MLYLASQSPRRAELLQQIQLPFSVVRVNVDETRKMDEALLPFVQRLAREKATAGLKVCDQAVWVLGADTLVVADDQVMGKPQDKADCQRMLRLLSDRTHQVYTAVCVAGRDKILQQLVTTDVTFRALTCEEIDAYWHSGEPADKAGAYGIQGIGGQFVKHIRGSYSAVVGLPLYETSVMLSSVGLLPNWLKERS